MPFSAPQGSRFVAEIGAGTTFEVAVVQWRGAEVIAKRLRRSQRTLEAARRTLARHREVLSRLRHPAVPALLHAGSDEYGPFLLEERAPGLPLRQLVEEHRRRHGPLPAEVLRRVAAAAFQSLAELHAARDARGPLGFVHGDLGPDHLFVAPTRSGGVGYVDFGQARIRGTLPEPGARGTLPFVAPEVARGGELDAAADVFALAATLAFAALGHDPCREEGPARLVEIAERGVDRAAVAGAEMDPGLRELLLAALVFERGARLVDAAEIASRLSSSLR